MKTLSEKKQFINDLISNSDVIRDEYLNFKRRSVPLPSWDDQATIVPGWTGIALWWDYKAWPSSQRRCPKTTELIRNGPDHRASGWLVLDSDSTTPEHNHKDWGHKIITHLPSVLPDNDDMAFFVEGKEYKWKMGELFAFDATKNHCSYNKTNERRSIFVLDFDYEEWIDVLRPYMYLED